MKLQATVAAIALMVGGTAQAAVVELTYEVTAEVVDYSYYNPFAGSESPLNQPYPGPVTGDVITDTFTAIVDTEMADGEFGDPVLTSYYFNFNPETGSGNFFFLFNIDKAVFLDLNDQGTGSYMEEKIYFGEPGISSSNDFEVLSYTVSGLPDIAPVPLPASLPLLGLGAAALFARRRKAVS